jgi:hypothetical protein
MPRLPTQNMTRLYCPKHGRKTEMLEFNEEYQTDPSVVKYSCGEFCDDKDEPCVTNVEQPVITTPLIEMSFDEAREQKFQIGRAEHGPVFLNNPVAEIDMELIDGMNYAEESIRQGFDKEKMTLIIEQLRQVDGLVREVYRESNR